ncbi:MAG: molybdopterin-binding protein, partial [Caldisericaceae bacterium]
AFRARHIIQESDIPLLLSIGRHYVWILDETDESHIHEDAAAKEIMLSSIQSNLSISEPSESRVKIFAESDGIFLVNKIGLRKLNDIDDISIASKRHLAFVRKGTPVAIGKVMPKEISVSVMDKARKVIADYFPIFDLYTIKKHTIALFPVGNEFIEGRRTETVSLNVAEYLRGLGQETSEREILPDNPEVIVSKTLNALSNGANLVVFIGGMGVDPDDRTVESIKKLGADVVKYGLPIWPGQNIVVAYLNKTPILGLPSGVALAKKNTSFHRILPIVLSDYKLSRDEILEMGEGGFIDVSDL